MKQIGERIKAARISKNLTQGQFAKLVGAKTGSVVSAWEMGVSKPDCERLSAICTVLGVTPDMLLGFESDSATPTEMIAVRKYRILDERGKTVVDAVLNTEYEIACEAQSKKKKRVIRIDYYAMPVSAGTGTFLDSEEADFVLRVSGDSMEPTFHDGDKIYVCKQSAIDVGDIGIFIINGDAYVKELGSGKLISHNEKYKPIPLKSDDSIFCCGRVLGVVDVVK